MNLQNFTIVRAIFKGRQLLLRSKKNDSLRPLGLAAQAISWGWGLLAEIPGREIVFGAVTQPWRANRDLGPCRWKSLWGFTSPDT